MPWWPILKAQVEQVTHNKEVSHKQTVEEWVHRDRVILLDSFSIFKGPSANLPGDCRQRPIPFPVVLFWVASPEGDWGCYRDFSVDCWAG